MNSCLSTRCTALLTELGLLPSGESVSVTPLTGGVASDIVKLTVGNKTYCAKFALPKLKVEADWYAPVHRNAAEYAWLNVVSSIQSKNSLNLYGRSAALHGFIMEYIDGDDVYLWKTSLLAQNENRRESIKVGDLLGLIHAASAKSAFNSTAFQNQNDFHALRIEPYLLHTALVHKDIATHLHALGSTLMTTQSVLVHGDVSPKNILFKADQPILLDAECATMGDPCFDLAFCLNHLILKAIHLSESRAALFNNTHEMWLAYKRHIIWESADQLEKRVCTLLPALMLARVDGKSPVEYLNQQEHDAVRSITKPFIRTPTESLNVFIGKVDKMLKELSL